MTARRALAGLVVGCLTADVTVIAAVMLREWRREHADRGHWDDLPAADLTPASTYTVPAGTDVLDAVRESARYGTGAPGPLVRGGAIELRKMPNA
jgi:hypothetical protein